MKAAVAILGVALAAHSPRSLQVAGIEKAVGSALSWHYRWIEPVPRDLASIECSVALFEDQSFAYCEPVLLSMDMETTAERPPRVTNILREHWDFARALADFRAHRNPKGEARGSVQRISIPVRGLGACKVDWKQTAQASALAVPQEQRTKFENEGLSLRYPVVCEGDPFYLVYFVRGENIEWIWLFKIYPEKIDLTWSFDSGTQQRKVPRLATDNLKKKELWYKVH